MNKNRLFTIIFFTSLLIILISLVSIMILTPSQKQNNLGNIITIDKNVTFSISTNFILKTTSNENFDFDTFSVTNRKPLASNFL